ncbi:hypothetical protein SERLA73DRAFT_165329 [Serpula lacrymans var. lacrymans S7.3]|uniref:CFA20 domain-containing protein n=2 Tax=Serpula lacrymans var. lacrymans TaxID=341189 RepID=F8PJA1_SERL3|nr:uncharacterized protein SERLADRAFT_445375 [Serpula lacrymans var. lacrymans S7.9]EGO03726.1 hypothetical protein SERLA73DRAFT_165329 [Serpula lacrymans var. lacrymans S7.3]EGO29591.1 hypothetical protein SERLADRAFT_445375 [Serpula lacrymans var. lacrymans S7.9]
MFSQSVQPNVVSLFSSTGSDPLGLFSVHTDRALPSDSFVHLLNDDTSLPHPSPPAMLVAPPLLVQEAHDESVTSGYSLSQTVLHIQSPSLPTTFIRTPPTSPNGRSVRHLSADLGMKHEWLHLQVRNMGREFSFEVGLVDRAGREGVVRCSTFQVLSIVSLPLWSLLNFLHHVFLCHFKTMPPCQRHDHNSSTYDLFSQKEPRVKMDSSPPILLLPLTFPISSSRPLTAWTIINLNISSLIPHYSSRSLASLYATSDIQGSPSSSRRADAPSGAYSHISYLKIYATCRLRRVWFSDSGPGGKVPWEFELYGDL